MTIFLALLFVLILASVKIKTETFAAACSVSQTQAIKGIFVITVFFSHFCSYVHIEAWYDKPLQAYCIFLGQLMVAPFLLYSGYGIFESVKKKGDAYIKDFPKKRILKTLIHFDFAVILFLILDLIIERQVSIPDFLLSLTAWESIGNSNWFIFAILCAYIFAFAGLIIFKGNLRKTLFVIIAMSIAYMVVVSQFKDNYWIDTILAFPMGCSLSLYKGKIDKILHSKIVTLVGGLLSIFVLLSTKAGYLPNSFFISQISLMAFCLAIIFFTLYIRLDGSRILSWFGANVFGIYILQRIPMNLGAYFHWNEGSIYMYFTFCFISTLLLAIAFHKATTFFDSKILNR